MFVGPGGGTGGFPLFEGCVRVAPGVNRTAAVQGLIAAGFKHFCFGEGEYVFEGQLFAGLTEAQVSGVQLIGAGDERTHFNVSYAPVIGDVDDPTTALLFYDGAPDGVVATDVAAGVPAMQGALSFTPTSTVGMAPGMRLRFQGHNTPGFPNDAAGMSDGADVVLTEMVEIDRIVAGDVFLTAPLLQWHAPGTPVDSVQPVTDVVVRGIRFDFVPAVGVSTVSNAIYSRCTDGIVVEQCSFRSMTRAGCELGPGTRNAEVEGLRGRGLLNGLLHCDSLVDFRIRDIKSDAGVERCHSLGIPRHLVFFQERCSSGSVHDLFLQGACAGLCFYGGTYIQNSGISATDMNTTEMRARNPLYGLAGYLGMGIESGAGPLNVASFAYDISYDAVDLYNLYGFGSSTFDVSWFHHDITLSSVGTAVISNKGPGFGTVIDGVTYDMVGIVLADLVGDGTIDSLTIGGCQLAWHSYGQTSITVSELTLSGSPGTNAGLTQAISINNTVAAGVPGGTPKFGRVLIDGWNGAFLRFGVDFLAAPDFNFTIREYEIQGFARWKHLRTARNNDVGPVVFSWGEGVIFDPASAAGELGVLTPVSDAVDAVVVIGAPIDIGTGIIMIAALPDSEQWVQTTAGAIVPGNLVTGAGAGLRTFVAGPGATRNSGNALRGNGGAAVLIPIGPQVT